MEVVVAGAHGKIALALTELLLARGDAVTGLIRNPDHAAEIRGRAVVCDLEHAGVDEVTAAVGGADAVVFAAGAGPGSGAARKLSMDRDGAITLRDAALAAGVGRYVMVSAVGAEAPPAGEDVFSVYLRANAQADAALAASALHWTIVRPGALTDDPATGTVRLQADAFRGRVARADVAAVLAATLHEPRLAGQLFYVNGGEDPIDAALARLLA